MMCVLQVLLQTTLGDLDVELWSKEAPLACRNFVQLCLEGYYDGNIFHRVIKGIAEPLSLRYTLVLSHFSFFSCHDVLSLSRCICVLLDFIAQSGDPTGTGEGIVRTVPRCVCVVGSCCLFVCLSAGGESIYGKPFKVCFCV